jgi:AcrR family transcriptional regulator
VSEVTNTDQAGRTDANPVERRPDAQRNREKILDVARVVVREHGTQASLRDVARRAEVGLGTLYRHFPTRDALLETLMRRRFEHLTARAGALGAKADPDKALTAWLTEFAYGAGAYRGLPGSIMATLADRESPLYASCDAMRRAGGDLLAAAQGAGTVRADLRSGELFALVIAVAWTAESAPEMEERRERLLQLILDGLRAPRR